MDGTNSNPYLDLLQPQPSASPQPLPDMTDPEQPAAAAEPPENPYLTLLKPYQTKSLDSGTVGLLASGPEQPDQIAAARPLAQHLGLSPLTVAPSLDELQQTFAAQKTQRQLDAAPKMAGWFDDQVKVALAKDDFQQLGFIDRTMAGWSQGRSAALDGAERGALLYRKIHGSLPDADQQRLDMLTAASKTPPQEIYGFVPNAARIAGSGAGFLQDLFVTGDPERRTGLIATGAATGAALGAGVGGIGTAPGAIAGAGGGEMAAAAGRAYETALGTMVGDLADVRDDTGDPLNPNAVYAAGIASGLINVALTVGTGGSAGRAIGGDLARTALKDAARQPGTLPAIWAFGKSLLKEVGKQAALGVAAEAGNVAAEQAARLTASGPIDTVWTSPDQRDQAGRRILAGTLEMAALAGMLHGVSGGIGLARDLRDTARAKDDASRFSALMAGAEDSKLRGRAPDLFSDFVRQQADGSPVENVFLPADKVRELYQSYGVEDPFALTDDPLFGQIDGFKDRLREAEAVGGDVSVPVGDYAARLAGSKADAALRPDLRLRPGAPSLRDALAAEARQAEQMAEIERQWQQQMTPTDQQAGYQPGRPDSPGAAVWQDVFSQLRAAGRTIRESEANADLLSAHYDTLAQRLSENGDDRDAWQLYSQAGLKIRQDSPELRQALSLSRDDFDATLDALRAGKTIPLRKQTGPSLAEWIARRGGITDPGGELAAMGADKWHLGKIGMNKLVRAGDDTRQGVLGSEPASKYHPDYVSTAAGEAGFFPDLKGFRPDMRTLFDALDQEMRGSPRYSEHLGDAAARAESEHLTGWREHLDKLGIDLTSDTGKSNAWVRAELERKQRENEAAAGQPGGAVLAQSGEAPVVKLPTEAQITYDMDSKEQQAARQAQNIRERAASRPSGEALKTLRKLAGDWFRDHLKGTAVANEQTGHIITFSGSKKMMSASANPDKLAMITILPSMLQRANPEKVEENYAKDLYQNIKRFHHYGIDVETSDGTRHHVRMVVREQTDGHLFYDHILEKKDGAAARDRTDPAYNAGGMSKDGEPVLNQSIAPDGDNLNLQLEQIGKDKVRGSITLPRGGFGRGNHLVTLFKAADRSTFLHESAHLFLEEMQHYAKEDKGFADDLQTVRDHVGATGEDALTPEQHETFARSFEAYLLEGKSPSARLADVFAKVKGWLLSLYERVVRGDAKAGLDQQAGFKIELTPEIRDVMDRLLASRDEIAAQREQQGLTPLFKSATDAKMTPEEFLAYRQTAERARDQAEQAVTRKVLAAKTRETKDWWKKELASETNLAQQEIDSQPAVQALHYVRTGEFLTGEEIRGRRLNLDLKSVRQLLGDKNLLDQMPKAVPPLLVDHGGVHPDMMAALFGYRDGKTMLDDLIRLNIADKERKAAGDSLPFRRAMARDLAEQRLRDRYGDPLHDGSLVDDAQEAVASSSGQMEVLAAEVAALDRQGRTGRKSASGPTLAQAAKSWAKRLTDDTRVGDLAPASLRRSERKTGWDAVAALGRGDHSGAAAAKQQQLLSAALIREQTKVKAEMDNIASRLSRYADADRLRGMDQDYLARIHDMLERFDFRPAGEKTVAARESLRDWVMTQEAQGAEIAVPDKLLNEAFRTHYRRLTVSDMRDLADSVENIAHLGRLKQTLIDNGKKRDFAAVKAEILGRMAEHPQIPDATTAVIGSRHGLKGTLERSGITLSSIHAALLKAEAIYDRLDKEDINGPFNRLIWRPLKEALFKEYDMQADVVKKWKGLQEQLPKDFSKGINDFVNVPELLNRDGKQMEFRRRDIIQLALNWGNEGNRDKLLRGYRWDQDTVQRVLDRHLQDADWQYVQGIWDIFESHWPQIEEMQKRLSGLAPERVDPVPFKTASGREMRGGYYPVVYDPLRDPRAAAHLADAQSASIFENSYARATTPTGHTKSRTDYAAPIALNMDVTPHRLAQMIHDLAFRETIMQAHKILTDAEIREAITRVVGRDQYNALGSALQAAANDRNVDWRNIQGMDKWLRQLRTNATAVGIGYRITTMLKHGASALSNSIGELGGWMISACRDLYADPFGRGKELRAEIEAKSGEMRYRMNQYDRDMSATLHEMMRSMSWRDQGSMADSLATVRDHWNHYGHIGVATLDYMSALPTWWGAYQKGLTSMGLAEKDAIAYADKTVRNAHGAQSILDQALVQRGSELQKMTTMFYGFFNHMYNRYVVMVRRGQEGVTAWKAGDKELAMAKFGQTLTMALFYLAVPALVEHLVSGKGHGPWSEDSDESWMGWGARAITGQVAGGVPILRDFAKLALEGRDAQFSPAFSMLADTVQLGADWVSGEEVHHPVKKAIIAAGLMTGIGTGMVGQEVQYLWDVLSGVEQPEDAADFLRAVLLGPPPKKHH